METPKQQSIYRNGLYTEEEFHEKVTKGEIQYVILCIPTYTNVLYKTYEAKFFSKHVNKSGTNISQLTLTFSTDYDYIKTKDYSTTGQGATVEIEVDKNTYRCMSWQGSDYAIVFGNIRKNEKDLHPLGPRNILVNLLKRYKEKYGLNLQCASELEYYMFNKTNTEITKDYPEINLDKCKLGGKELLRAHSTSKMESFHRVLKDHIKNSGIELEGIILEYGPGQMEANYVYGEALRSCDNHLMIKQCIKHVCDQNGYGCTFMAKPFADKSGSASHIHLSINDANGKNFFAPSNFDKENHEFMSGDKKIKFHSRLVNFIGGICKYNRELFLAYAPVVNSYKRFKHSLSTPFYVNTWGYDNKFSTIRILGNEEDVHIEVRIAGSDANIYNIMTAIYASGMKGIEERINPPEMETANSAVSVSRDYQSAPKNLDDATDLFEESSFAQEIFGKELHDLMVCNAREDWSQFNGHISNFEVNKYLDNI